eukprot:jgi/Mesvir1/4054/Mv22182-RA.1
MKAEWGAFADACSGAVGGLCSTVLLYPIDTAKTRYQAECKGKNSGYSGLFDVLIKILQHEGIFGLFPGLGPKCVHSVFSQFVYFYSYSYLTRRYARSRGIAKITTTANLVLGALAGCVTVLITQPLDTFSIKCQVDEHGRTKRPTLKDCYDGLGTSLVLTCVPAIQFTVFERLKNELLRGKRRRLRADLDAGKMPRSSTATGVQLSAWDAFLIGAAAKCVASLITYPGIRLKILQQTRTTTVEDDGAGAMGGGHRDSGMGGKGVEREGEEEEGEEEADEEGEEEEGEEEWQSPALMVDPVVASGSRREDSSSTSIWATARSVYEVEGWRGFYKGLQAQILKTVLGAAVLFMIKEKTYQATLAAMLLLRRSQQRALRHKAGLVAIK